VTAQVQEITESSHTGHCTQTAESADGKIQSFITGNTLRVPNVATQQAATLYALTTRLYFMYIIANILHNGDNK
jgi:hypothetical protein